jgi:hypothetical protein
VHIGGCIVYIGVLGAYIVFWQFSFTIHLTLFPGIWYIVYIHYTGVHRCAYTAMKVYKGCILGVYRLCSMMLMMLKAHDSSTHYGTH